MLSTAAFRLLKDLAETANVPILRAISGVVLLVFETAELSTQNRQGCRTLCEQIFELVLTVSHELEGASEDLPDELLECLDELNNKLVHIQQFIHDNLRKKSLTQFLNSGRNAEILTGYRSDVRRSLEVFQLQSQVLMHRALNEEQARKLDWVAAFPPEIQVADKRRDSGSASPQSPEGPAPPPYSLENNQKIRAASLPNKPCIFFGRQTELDDIVQRFACSETPSARICVLGAPGMGKTSLVLSAVHAQAVADKFGPRRFFIPCDSADSAKGLLSVLASAFGIISDMPRAIQSQLIHRLSSASPTLLVLDNFESPWEAECGRPEVEALLATLAAIENLALAVTLRGTERPAGVDWSRPFIAPLSPLPSDAARQVFMTISDVVDEDPDVAPLLDVVENMPLGIMLMANLAQYESTRSLRARWDGQQTSMLNRGAEQRHSNLDFSIHLSVDSPRMQGVPDAKSMLYMLSLLPDGIERDTLLSIAQGMRQPAQCLSRLLQTSLAYRDTGTRIRVLSPIRSFVLRYLGDSAAPAVLYHVYEHYFSLAQLGEQFGTAATRQYLDVCVPEVGNIEAVLTHALADPATGASLRERAVKAATLFSTIARYTGLGNPAPILELGLEAMRSSGNKAILADVMLALASIAAIDKGSSRSADQLIADAMVIYEEMGNVEGQIDCLRRNWTVATQQDIGQVFKALSMSEEIGDLLRQGQCHLELGQRYMNMAESDKARHHFTLAQSLLKDVDECYLRARCTFSLANVLCADGQLSLAIEQYREALALMESINSLGGSSHCSSYMGWVYRRMGLISSAVSYTQWAIDGYQKSGFVMDETLAYVQLAQCYCDDGEVDGVQRAVDNAAQALAKTNPKWLYGRAQVAFARGDAAFAERDLALAEASYWQAIALFRQRRSADDEAEVRVQLGYLALARDDANEAITNFVTSVALLRTLKSPCNLGAAVNGLAEALLSQDDHSTALAVTRSVLPCLNSIGRTRETGRCFERLSSISFFAGEQARAQVFCSNALDLYERGGDSAGIERCRTLSSSCSV